MEPPVDPLGDARFRIEKVKVLQALPHLDRMTCARMSSCPVTAVIDSGAEVSFIPPLSVNRPLNSNTAPYFSLRLTLATGAGPGPLLSISGTASVCPSARRISRSMFKVLRPQLFEPAPRARRGELADPSNPAQLGCEPFLPGQDSLGSRPDWWAVRLSEVFCTLLPLCTVISGPGRPPP